MENGMKLLTVFGKIAQQVKHLEVTRPIQLKLMPKIQIPLQRLIKKLTQEQMMIPNQKVTGYSTQLKMLGSIKRQEKSTLLEIKMLTHRLNRLNPKKMEIGIKMLMAPGSTDRQVKKLEAKRQPLTFNKIKLLNLKTVRSHGTLMRIPMSGLTKLLVKESQMVRRRSLSKMKRRLVRKTHGHMTTLPSNGLTQKLGKHGQTMEKLSKKDKQTQVLNQKIKQLINPLKVRMIGTMMKVLVSL
jgi:hypothetical protein